MDASGTYALATSSWLALQSVPLIVSPKMMIALLSAEPHDASLLEIYFARTSGLALFFFALVTLTLSGVLPLAPSSGSDTAAAPYGQATTLLTMFHHAVSSFYCWAVYSYTTRQAYTVGVTGIMLGAIGSAILGAAGVGTMLFGGDTRISKKTGLDKRTSAWPFKNEAAHPERKREMRKGM